jgi:thiamine biosynthesis lipoprotein
VARQTILRMGVEIDRLDSIFSLYRSDSEIVRLNRDGRLLRPSDDLVEVVEQALGFADLSGGAFDPAVQPIWTLYAAHFAGAGADPAGPPAKALARAQALADFRRIAVGRREIVLEQAGMAITLNGIAQGHITDRIADLLRQEGFDQAMVELGETRALGAAPGGSPFRVALMNPSVPGLADRTVDLADAALSVSGGYGMRWAGGTSHHIFDPATGRSANRLLDVAVIAPRARDADALSTAIFVAGEAAGPALLRQVPDARALLTRGDGSAVSL